MEKTRVQIRPDIQSAWCVRGGRAFRIGEGVSFLMARGWKLARNRDSNAREYTSLYPPDNQSFWAYTVEVPTDDWIDKVSMDLHRVRQRERMSIEGFEIGYEYFPADDPFRKEDGIVAVFCIAGHDGLWRVAHVWHEGATESRRIGTCCGRLPGIVAVYANACLDDDGSKKPSIGSPS